MNRDTICVQGGYTPGNGEPRQIPIIQSTTFKYATSEDMGKLFDLEADGYFYSRLQNPTCDMVAKKICELEGGTAAMHADGITVHCNILLYWVYLYSTIPRRSMSLLRGIDSLNFIPCRKQKLTFSAAYRSWSPRRYRRSGTPAP